MPGPFDVTMKHMLEADPSAWLALAGLPPGPARLVDADLSTVTAEADKVVLVEASDPYVAHIEFQSSYDPAIGRRLLRYNALLDYRHNLPVESVLVLLREGADGPAASGQYVRRVGAADPHLTFNYHLVRLWQQPPEVFLDGPSALLPLVPLTHVTEDGLPRALARMRQRTDQMAAAAEAGTLWTSAYILMGLRFDARTVARMLQGVGEMIESSTYRAILDEGAEKELRALIVKLGEARLGAADIRIRAELDAVGSIGELEAMVERIFESRSWQELLSRNGG